MSHQTSVVYNFIR